MWYLIAGKLMSFIAYISFKSLLDLDINNITSIQKFFGWFLIEHMFEEYKKTSGKFFLINEDFRSLIKNILIIVRNVLIWSHFLTFTEFILTVSILVLLTYFLIYFLRLTKTKNILRESVLFIYYLLVMFVLGFNLFLSFNLFDLCFIFNPVIILLILLFINYKILNFLYRYASNTQKKLIILKIFFYVGCFVFINLIFLNSVLIINIFNDNIVQESVLKVLIIYIYCYYLFKFKYANYYTIM